MHGLRYDSLQHHCNSDVSIGVQGANLGPRAPSLSILWGAVAIAFALLIGMVVLFSHNAPQRLPQMALVYSTATRPVAATKLSPSLTHHQPFADHSAAARLPSLAFGRGVGPKTRPGALYAADGYLMGTPQAWSPKLPTVELGPEASDSTKVLIAVVVAGLAVVAYRTVVYFQLQYITAALIGNHVPRGVNATCLELGIGGGRNLYYYPNDIKGVIGVDSKSNPELLQKTAEKCFQSVQLIESPTAAADTWGKKVATASVDCVVSIQTDGASAKVLAEVARVLRPGGKLIFVEPGDSLLTAIANSTDFLKSEVDDGWLSGPLNKTAIGVAIRAGSPVEAEQPGPSRGKPSKPQGFK